jgi:VWFA-related protein
MTLMAALLIAAAAAQAPPPSPQPPSFPASVESVYLDVAVRREGQPVPGLTAADFVLTDEGAPRQVEVVEGANAPVHAILALDVSSSVQGSRLEALRGAARAFLEGLGPKDRATLLTFSHRVRLETAVGAAPADARAALDRTQPGGGTALFDAVFAAVALADRRHGRPIVVLFSDGADELSWLSEERLHALVRDGMGVVHAVASTALPAHARQVARVELDDRGRDAREGVGGMGTGSTGSLYGGKGTSDATRVFDAQMNASRQTAKGAEIPAVLTALASETGGQVWRADDDAALGPAFASALAEVRSRYVLRFDPAGGRPGEWRDVRVRVKNIRGDVHARKGYRVR